VGRYGRRFQATKFGYIDRNYKNSQGKSAQQEKKKKCYAVDSPEHVSENVVEIVIPDTN
jgi:hypothetical protein